MTTILLTRRIADSHGLYILNRAKCQRLTTMRSFYNCSPVCSNGHIFKYNCFGSIRGFPTAVMQSIIAFRWCHTVVILSSKHRMYQKIAKVSKWFKQIIIISLDWLIDWLIDCLIILLNVQWTSFQLYSEREQVQ
jgi:hypothetical protein